MNAEALEFCQAAGPFAVTEGYIGQWRVVAHNRETISTTEDEDVAYYVAAAMNHVGQLQIENFQLPICNSPTSGAAPRQRMPAGKTKHQTPNTKHQTPKMKLETLNRKASWALALAAALLIGYQQAELNQARRNERAAHEAQAGLQLENHALRQVAAGKRTSASIAAQSASWAAPFLRPLAKPAGAERGAPQEGGAR